MISNSAEHGIHRSNGIRIDIKVGKMSWVSFIIPDTKMSEEAQNEYWDRVRAYQAEGRGEEQMTVFSEMLSEGKIKFTDNIFKKIRSSAFRSASIQQGSFERSWLNSTRWLSARYLSSDNKPDK